MNNQAFEIVNDTFEKMAGIGDYKLRFTKDNPNKASKEEFDEFVALGAKIDNNQATKQEIARFNELTPKIPDRFLSLPHFEKKAGVKDVYQAAKDVKYNKMMLNKMKELAMAGAKGGNGSYTQMAGDGLNEYGKALDFSKTLLKHEAKKLGKDVAITGGLAAGGVAGGKYIGSKMKKKKQEKTAFNIVDETFEKIAAPNFGKAIAGGFKNYGKTLTGKNVKDVRALAEESASALGFVPGEGQTMLDGASDYLKKKLVDETRRMKTTRALTGVGVAGSVGGGAYLNSRNKKKK